MMKLYVERDNCASFRLECLLFSFPPDCSDLCCSMSIKWESRFVSCLRRKASHLSLSVMFVVLSFVALMCLRIFFPFLVF